MSNRLKIRCCILLASSLALPVLGDPAVVDRPTITTEGAKALIAKAEAKARSLGRTVDVAVEMQGGIPLKRRGEIIGAIGVSGADSSFDIPIAEAAVEDPAQ